VVVAAPGSIVLVTTVRIRESFRAVPVTPRPMELYPYRIVVNDNAILETIVSSRVSEEFFEVHTNLPGGYHVCMHTRFWVQPSKFKASLDEVICQSHAASQAFWQSHQCKAGSAGTA
jgi:hypothetical protein